MPKETPSKNSALAVPLLGLTPMPPAGPKEQTYPNRWRASPLCAHGHFLLMGCSSKNAAGMNWARVALVTPRQVSLGLKAPHAPLVGAGFAGSAGPGPTDCFAPVHSAVS